jgi:glycosyltransferase involved in cell wall biosynthesis
VSDNDLYRWLSTARLVVTLSQQEAFGLQVLEGVAAGVPVVASDIPAHREAGNHATGTGVTFVSPEGSPLEVADAIRNALTVPAQAPVRPLPSWTDVVDRTLALYEELMRTSPTRVRTARPGRPGRVEPHGRSGVAIGG